MGLSQERLAEAMMVDTTTVARWERGETEPQAVHRPRLAVALKLSVEEVGDLVGPHPSTAPARTIADVTAGPDGGRSAYLHASGALRTVEDISVFLRRDMFTRRDVLTASVAVTTGAALVEPVVHWFGTQPAGLPASEVSWMSHDIGMTGPAQRYGWYSIQAAREAGTEWAQLRAIGTLLDLARQAQAAGNLHTARRLVDVAIEQVPSDHGRFNAVRATALNVKASTLSGMGASQLSEVNSYVDEAFDLYRRAGDDEFSPAVAESFVYISEAELASGAAECYRDLAQEDPQLAARAEEHARYALDNRGDGYARSKVFDQVTLARVRFRAGELEQACVDAEQAIQMAATVSGSARVRTSLGRLINDTAPHQQRPAVRELRDRLTLAVAANT